MDGYVTKPIGTADLFAAIESAIGKSKPLATEPALISADIVDRSFSRAHR